MKCSADGSRALPSVLETCQLKTSILEMTPTGGVGGAVKTVTVLNVTCNIGYNNGVFVTRYKTPY